MLTWIKRTARKYEQFKWNDPVTRRECIEQAFDAWYMRNVNMV